MPEVVEAGIHQNIRADMICFVLGPKDNGIKDDDKVPKGKRAGIAGGNIGSGEWVRGVNNPRADVGEAGKVVLLGAAVKAAPEGGAEKEWLGVEVIEPLQGGRPDSRVSMAVGGCDQVKVGGIAVESGCAMLGEEVVLESRGR